MILERRFFVLVLLAAAEVVGEMDSAVTTADPIFLEANALDLPERHGQTRDGGGARMGGHEVAALLRDFAPAQDAFIVALICQRVAYCNC